MPKRRLTRIDRLIDTWEPAIRRAFRESIDNIKSAAQVSQIERMLTSGDVEGALRAVDLDRTSFRPLDQTVSRAFEAGGVATAKSIPKVRGENGLVVRFNFDIRNPSAERWLQERSSRKVVEILNDQRNMIRAHLVEGLKAGNGPRSMALDLVGRIGPSGRREGGVLGLTSSQAQWVRNYSSELASDNPTAALSRKLRDRRFDSAVKAAAESGEPIPAELRQKMVQAYENRALRLRAEGIARTEAMASLHESQQQAIEQAVETGNLSSDQVTFIWRATKDDRTRDSHADMNGQEVSMGEKFVTGSGAELEFPGDPNGPPEEVINCRCWREPSVDFLAGVE